MKILSKFLILLAAFCMLVAATTAVSAAEGCTATITGATAKAGNEITLSISVKNSPGIVGAHFCIEYDSDIMSYVSAVGTSDNFLLTAPETEGENPVRLIIINFNLSNVSGDFSAADIKFEIADDAPAGTYDIDLTVEEAYNYAERPVSVTAVDSTVVVKSSGPFEPSYGDVNNDGEVTVRDAAMVLQHIADWDVDIDTDMADVNLSGSVTVQDAALILQYIAGWDVVLGE